MKRWWTIGACLLALGGCELVVDFDRSRIVEDAGDDAPSDAGDDAAVDDAGADAETDAGDDAAADAGDDAGDDAGMDAGDDAGMDAGDDAGPDAGDDAGMDAGDDAGPMCTMPSECDDMVDCTTNACTAGDCVYTPDDAMCDDMNPCTANTCDMTMGCMATTTCTLTATPTVDLRRLISLESVNGGEGGLLLVVREDDSGSAGNVIEVVTIAAGEQMDVALEFDRDLVDGETLYVELYVDNGVIGTYEDGTDTLAQDADAMDISDSFTVTVPASTADFQVTISGDGADYTFTNALPSTWTVTGTDPALTLVRGARYRFVNESTAGHPFEFLLSGGAVALSQTSAGAQEGIAAIGWVEDGNDIEFTVSSEFEMTVDAYQCEVHPATMQGTVSYTD